MSAAIRTIVDGRDLKELLQRHEHVIVVCWLRECDASRWLLMALEQFADANEGRVAAGELDVEDNDDLCEALDITETPTLLFFRQGKLIMRELVALPLAGKADLLQRVEAAKETWRSYFWRDMPSRAVAT